MIERPSVSDTVAMLRASLHRGTPRPHPTAQGMSDTRRAELDSAARVEMLERSGLAPGEHPAPMHLDVVDLLDEAAALHPDDVDGEADWSRRAMSALGLIVDGQLLPGALCPWCDGRTIRGTGTATLRVRLVVTTGGAERVVRSVSAPVVVCEGLHCTPDQGCVGAWWHGRPAWPQSEWEWLARRIEAADEARKATRCRCGNPVPAGRAGGQRAAYCSRACRLAAAAERRRSQRAQG